MEEYKEFETEQQLIDFVQTQYPDAVIVIKEYSNIPDNRIGWSRTRIIMAEWRNDKFPTKFPVGFCD